MSISVDNVLAAKCHVWTLKSKSNPKTRQYWLDVKNGIVVINPEAIASQLESAKQKVAQAKNDWKEILIVCEKTLFREEIEQLSEEGWYHYLNYKVPGWVLTNFDTLMMRVKSMNELKSFIESEEYESLTKKEKFMKLRQLKKVEVVYKWVKNLKNKPWLVIIVDGQYMSRLVDEIEKTNTDNIIVTSTDFDRWWKEENLVMANVSFYDSMKLVLEYILK